MEALNRLFNYAKEKKIFMILALIFSGIATVLSFFPYYFFWKILKEITTTANASVIKQISFYIFLTTALYAITYALTLTFSHVFAFRLETNMKKRGLKHLLNASFSFFDINPSGKTRKIIDDNTGNTHTIIAHILPDSVNAVLFPIGVLTLSFVANWKIGILVLIVVVLALICFKFMFTEEDGMKDYMTALEDINSETVEYVRGIQVIKVFGLGLESFKKLHKSILHYSKVVNNQCQKCRTPFVLYQCLMMSFGALIIVIAYPLIEANTSTSEVISLVVFFMTFVGLLNNAFIKIMYFSRNYSMAKDAIDRLDDLFKKMDENKLITGNITSMKSYDIEFEDVTFEYEKGVSILDNFSLKLESGKKYALVGSSGGGKSTIAKLISGFYPVSSGRIKIGGVDIREYENTTLEKNIAFVFQHAKLFNKSIYENVKVGNPNASHEEVMQALKIAMCESILDKFDVREKTIIGAEGVHLSGGEIQRIAIARAILKDAPIIILDEASAASDPENEYEIQKAFSHLMENKTVIMIAHRLSSIRNVDEILIVDEGKVLERGSHNELMTSNTRYKRFRELSKYANEWRVINEI
ncbi:ABC transporter ATP-binding protein [Gemella cuniculi]|uniref:ABC transporter ATP-binding protein n=1 Tax=Gemella cuniculi TaxID=150240 RepID=UPI00041C7D53|nr:ABC transporter ATP-binding protein [Gemella cuniculi]